MGREIVAFKKKGLNEVQYCPKCGEEFYGRHDCIPKTKHTRLREKHH